MRISDWSSDVCSSDLPSEFEATGPLPKRQPQDNFGRRHRLPQGLGVRATMPNALKHHPILPCKARWQHAVLTRSAEHTSDLQSLMRSSHAVSCLKNKTHMPSTA